MIAFQVALDIEHNATQEFCSKVIASLPPAPADSYPVELVEKPKEANEMEVDEKAPLVTDTSSVPVPVSSPKTPLGIIPIGRYMLMFS